MTTGLPVFDKTLNITNNWLKEIEERMGRSDRQVAYVSLRSTLHALRDRLTKEEASHLGAELPMLVRGIYFESWDFSRAPRKIRSQEEFIEEIRQNLAEHTDINPEEACRAVFSMLENRISEGEIEDIKDMLPNEFEGFFSESADAVK